MFYSIIYNRITIHYICSFLVWFNVDFSGYSQEFSKCFKLLCVFDCKVMEKREMKKRIILKNFRGWIIISRCMATGIGLSMFAKECLKDY